MEIKNEDKFEYLMDKWTDLFAFINYADVDIEEIREAESVSKYFSDLVAQTIPVIQEFRAKEFDLENNVAEIKNYLWGYINLIRTLEMFSSFNNLHSLIEEESCGEDDIVEYLSMQSVTRLISNYATLEEKCETDNTGVLVGSAYDMFLHCYNQSSKKVWEKNFTYDPKDGDLSKIASVVKLSQEFKNFSKSLDGWGW